MSNNKALVIIDYINEIVHPDGKLAGKGYADFIEKKQTSAKVSELLTIARSNSWLVCHVRVGFDPEYTCHPSSSPLFGPAKKFRALNQSGWGCEFIEYAQPATNEFVVHKRRVSAFYKTDLEVCLRANHISEVYLAGCATDLAVQSAARDCHDRDFQTLVVIDACAAAHEEDHQTSIPVLEKIAQVVKVSDL